MLLLDSRGQQSATSASLTHPVVDVVQLFGVQDELWEANHVVDGVGLQTEDGVSEPQCAAWLTRRNASQTFSFAAFLVCSSIQLSRSRACLKADRISLIISSACQGEPGEQEEPELSCRGSRPPAYDLLAELVKGRLDEERPQSEAQRVVGVPDTGLPAGGAGLQRHTRNNQRPSHKAARSRPSEPSGWSSEPAAVKQYLLGSVEALQQSVLSVLEALIQSGHALLNQGPHHVVVQQAGKEPGQNSEVSK